MFPIIGKKRTPAEHPLLNKFSADGDNPIQAEQKNRLLEPQQLVLDKKLEEWVNKQWALLQADASLSPEQRVARLHALEFHNSINKQTEFMTNEKKEFVLDFIDWLQYKDPENEADPKHVRNIERQLGKLGATVRNGPLDVAGKDEWLSEFIDKKQKYSRDILKLRMGPHNAKMWTLHDAWLYYKFILRGQKIPDESFLDDFDDYYYNKFKTNPGPRLPGGGGGWDKGRGRLGFDGGGGGQLKNDEEFVWGSKGVDHDEFPKQQKSDPIEEDQRDDVDQQRRIARGKKDLAAGKYDGQNVQDAVDAGVMDVDDEHKQQDDDMEVDEPERRGKKRAGKGRDKGLRDQPPPLPPRDPVVPDVKPPKVSKDFRKQMADAAYASAKELENKTKEYEGRVKDYEDEKKGMATRQKQLENALGEMEKSNKELAAQRENAQKELERIKQQATAEIGAKDKALTDVEQRGKEEKNKALQELEAEAKKTLVETEKKGQEEKEKAVKDVESKALQEIEAKNKALQMAKEEGEKAQVRQRELEKRLVEMENLSKKNQELVNKTLATKEQLEKEANKKLEEAANENKVLQNQIKNLKSTNLQLQTISQHLGEEKSKDAEAMAKKQKELLNKVLEEEKEKRAKSIRIRDNTINELQKEKTKLQEQIERARLLVEEEQQKRAAAEHLGAEGERKMRELDLQLKVALKQAEEAKQKEVEELKKNATEHFRALEAERDKLKVELTQARKEKSERELEIQKKFGEASEMVDKERQRLIQEATSELEKRDKEVARIREEMENTKLEFTRKKHEDDMTVSQQQQEIINAKLREEEAKRKLDEETERNQLVVAQLQSQAENAIGEQKKQLEGQIMAQANQLALVTQENNNLKLRQLEVPDETIKMINSVFSRIVNPNEVPPANMMSEEEYVRKGKELAEALRNGEITMDEASRQKLQHAAMLAQGTALKLAVAKGEAPPVPYNDKMTYQERKQYSKALALMRGAHGKAGRMLNEENDRNMMDGVEEVAAERDKIYGELEGLFKETFDSTLKTWLNDKKKPMPEKRQRALYDSLLAKQKKAKEFVQDEEKQAINTTIESLADWMETKKDLFTMDDAMGALAKQGLALKELMHCTIEDEEYVNEIKDTMKVYGEKLKSYFQKLSEHEVTTWINRVLKMKEVTFMKRAVDDPLLLKEAQNMIMELQTERGKIGQYQKSILNHSHLVGMVEGMLSKIDFARISNPLDRTAPATKADLQRQMLTVGKEGLREKDMLDYFLEDATERKLPAQFFSEEDDKNIRDPMRLFMEYQRYSGIIAEDMKIDDKKRAVDTALDQENMRRLTEAYTMKFNPQLHHRDEEIREEKEKKRKEKQNKKRKMK